MKTINDYWQLRLQLDRLSRLSPETRPLWGLLTAADLLPHLSDPFWVALGELEAIPAKSFFSTRIGKFIAIYLLPRWPKGAPTHPKTDITKQGRKGRDFEQDRLELISVIDRFILQYPAVTFCDHPVFGKISNRTWAIVMNKHLDHHFRQFGL